MTNDTLPLPTRTVEVRIGWTKSALPEYSSFSDGYRVGAEQVTHDITLDVPVHLTPEDIAEAAFYATNAPSVGEFSLPGQIAAKIAALGYRGQGAHYSLSVGDTVTVGEVMLACASCGWERVR